MSPLRHLQKLFRIAPAALAFLLFFQSSLHILSHADDAAHEAQASCQLCLDFAGLDSVSFAPSLSPFLAFFEAGEIGRYEISLRSFSFLIPPARGPPSLS